MTHLPTAWRSERLGGLLEVLLDHRGKTPGKLGGEFQTEGIPVISAIHIKTGRLDMSQRFRFVDYEMFLKWMPRPLRKGDVLLTSEAPLGLVAQVPDNSPLVLSQRLFALRGKAGVLENRYLRWVLEAPIMRDQIFSRSSGSTVTGIRQSELVNIKLPLPPVTEQRRIIDILEDHLSRLDAAEELLKRNRLRATRYSEAFLRSTLTGKDLGLPLVEASLPRVESDDGKLPSLPAGWRWQRLGEIADVTGGITKDSKNQANTEWQGVPYLRVANVQRGRLDLSSVSMIKAPAAKIESMSLEPGDVLLNEGGDRDKLARGWVWEGQLAVCIHQNHVFRARVRSGAIEPRLLSWSANTFGGPWAERNGKQTTNLASISMRRIRLMPIPVPPVEMQIQLVQAIDRALEGVDLLVSALERAQWRQMSLRRALLNAAFSGRLTGRTSDMDRAEEMADV